ncbi:MAG: hypothetical protein R3Y07_03110 [Eubacteriales bacterium]
MKEGMLFPLIMIAVTLIGGGFFFFYLKMSENKQSEEEPTMKTAQSFVNVKNLKDRFLYTTEGQTILFVRIQSVSIDLYSKSEKRSLMRQLTTELSEISYSFKFMALSRPVNIEPLIQSMMRTARTASEIRRELLDKEIQYLNDFTLSEDIVERQFYLSVWDKTDAYNENELAKRANILAEKFTSCGVAAEVIGEKDIIQLINYVYNPATASHEDTDYYPCIPIISEEDD